MRTKFILLPFILLIWSCKKQAKPSEPKTESIVEVQKVSQKSPILEELVVFADFSFTDSTNIGNIFAFKEIDHEGVLSEIDLDSARSLYRKLMKRAPATSFPIFEIKGTAKAILPIQGKGYGGAIWAKVLIDRNSLEIKKIAFDHKAESEGYGAEMSRASFEDQFVGKKIDLEKNTFQLEQQMEKRTDDGILVEGISGATMTSEAVIEMVNQGLGRYRTYLTDI